ncbi:MAG: hypothetical protein GY859_03885 [Desulfobacterales bacterium]|nr:hypothetical protein [Desulfobacterales bacterium]
MRDLFKDILEMEGVRGVLLISFEGAPIFREMPGLAADKVENAGWWLSIIDALDGAREADLVFSRARLYIRKSESGYLFIALESFCSAPMVRLNCDILLPSLTETKQQGSISRFFTKKRSLFSKK